MLLAFLFIKINNQSVAKQTSKVLHSKNWGVNFLCVNFNTQHFNLFGVKFTLLTDFMSSNTLEFFLAHDYK